MKEMHRKILWSPYYNKIIYLTKIHRKLHPGAKRLLLQEVKKETKPNLPLSQCDKI